VEVVKLLLEKGAKKLQSIITKSLYNIIYIYYNNFDREGLRGAHISRVITPEAKEEREGERVRGS
jgi:hypothetical protein